MNQKSGSEYWKSLDQRAASPEFQEWVEREFPEGASELGGVNRRNFLKLMAASFSLAGVSTVGCRRPKKHVLPYSQQPENLIQGVPNFYATSFPRPWGNLPLIVESHQGRPTKIEGNPSYKKTGGASDVFSQASVLDLYDPDRLKQSTKGKNALKRPQVLDLLDGVSGSLKESGGKGIAFLAEPSTSPSREALVTDLLKEYPEAIWAEYSAISHAGFESMTEKSLGKRYRQVLHLDKAKRILTVDSDPLGMDPDCLTKSKGFAKSRKVKDSKEAKKMNRLYTVESNLTLTGSSADHRLRLETSRMEAYLALLATVLSEKAGTSTPLVEGVSLESVESVRDWVEACADDLLAHKGKSVVIAGDHLSERCQLLTVFINTVLGAEGKTCDFLDVSRGYTPSSIVELAQAVKNGGINTLIIIGGNPAYDAPADLDFAFFSKAVEKVIRFGTYFDETAEAAGWTVAASHYLESWDSGRTGDGTFVPVQPLIEPLYETFSELEFLARATGSQEKDPYALVKAKALELYPELVSPGAFEAFLAEGVVKNSELKPIAGVSSQILGVEIDFDSSGDSEGLGLNNLELRFVESYHTQDGRSANNGWLMECPDPLTKLTWDNAILISPYLAKKLEENGAEIFPNSSLLNELGIIQKNKSIFKRGKEEAPVATITLNGVEVSGPIHVQPGLADYTVVLSKGFGRDVGRIAAGAGFDVYPLTSSDSSSCRVGAKLELTGDTYPLANTQEHWSMEGRAIVREGTAADYAKHPDFATKMGTESHSPPIYGEDEDKPIEFKAVKTPRGGSMYDPPNFEVPDRFNPDDPDAMWAPQQWGMTIDLNTCTGCTACIVACQSENNIPIVGKDQVRRGREMHWVRLDRYFSSADNNKTDIPDDVQVSFMGMSCVHCELAPCETVCPVNATVHDDQGLNVMAYNRCVGTRYCANNCPYKVRRFNFFDWHKREIDKFYQGPLGPVDEPEVEHMVRNPDVTVRMRGVMEKCTYCVQRIEAAKIRQKSLARDSNNIKVPDGTIKTACQQVCPSDCIEFGDITDTKSAVYEAKESDRNYSVLGYLNTRPRTTYLAKLRNPNPDMPEAYRYKLPYTKMEYKSKSHSSGSHGDHSKDAKHEEHTPAGHH